MRGKIEEDDYKHVRNPFQRVFTNCRDFDSIPAIKKTAQEMCIRPCAPRTRCYYFQSPWTKITLHRSSLQPCPDPESLPVSGTRELPPTKSPALIVSLFQPIRFSVLSFRRSIIYSRVAKQKALGRFEDTPAKGHTVRGNVQGWLAMDSRRSEFCRLPNGGWISEGLPCLSLPQSNSP